MSSRTLSDVIVSIHAPREGSDIKRGSRGMILHVFQSTLPAKGATGVALACRQLTDVSIHAPREGSDG